MDTPETTTAATTPETQAPPPASDAAAGAESAAAVDAGEKRSHRPRDPARRDASARRAAVRNEIRRLKEATDLEELDKLYAKRRARRTGEPEPEAAPEAAGGAALARRGPDPLASARTEALAWWNSARLLASGSRYEFSEAQAQFLAERCAPVLVKYGALDKLGPEAQALLAVAMVFGAPAFAHGMEILAEREAKREASERAQSTAGVGE